MESNTLKFQRLIVRFLLTQKVPKVTVDRLKLQIISSRGGREIFFDTKLAMEKFEKH